MTIDLFSNFAVLNINVNETEINDWFNADGPKHKYPSDQDHVELYNWKTWKT